MNLKKAEPLSKFRVVKRTFCEGAVFYHRWMVVIDAKMSDRRATEAGPERLRGSHSVFAQAEGMVAGGTVV